MSLLVPDGELVVVVESILSPSTRLKLYSNNHTPSPGDSTIDYIEVTGGGYASVVLDFGTWTITADAIATYITIDFTFTGTTDAPGTVYGYYVLDGSNNLLWAERFPDTVLPFTPVVNSLVRITPRIQVA